MSYHVGDTAPDLTGKLTSAGAAKDVTGAALEVHVRKPDGTTLTRAATAADPVSGEWSMPWQTGDLDASGTHLVEVQVTYSNGKVQTFGPDRLWVAAELA